jgi:CubicO group peptidase (beta-lactamase class C family)
VRRASPRRAPHPLERRRRRRGHGRAIIPRVHLDGHADAGFGPVADAFGRNFETLGEIGAAVAVYHRGRLVVDLAAGADPIRDRPFTRATLTMVAS